ncbi:PTS sugar transporter subunit IIB [Rhodoglobus sp. NPDC076762]
MATKRILVICGTGVATSTVVVTKIRTFCESKGLDAKITQGKVADTLRGNLDADFIVATTQVPDSVGIPVIAGLPFLTGMGLDKVYAEIEQQFA